MSVYTIVKDRTEKKEKRLAGCLCMTMDKWLERGGNYRGSIGRAAKEGFYTIRECQKMGQPVTVDEFKNCMDFVMMKDCYTDNCLTETDKNGYRKRPCLPVFKRDKKTAPCDSSDGVWVQEGIAVLQEDKPFDIKPKVIVYPELLKFIRQEQCLTQKSFAKKIGVSNSTVSKWLYGEAFPNPGTVRRIATVFGLSKDDALELFAAPKAVV